MALILHITRAEEWKRAESAGIYRGDTLGTQGFIHCSRPSQIVKVANALYAHQTGLVILCVDSEKLRSELRFEGSSKRDSYPHIYGPLNLEAIVRVLSFEPDVDGTFSLPKELDHLTSE